MFYRVCPYCKATLDPQEKCDCQDYHQIGRKEAATAFSSLNNKGTQKKHPHQREKFSDASRSQSFTINHKI